MKKGLIGLILIFFTALIMVNFVSAEEDVNKSKYDLLKAKCQSVKLTLRQVNINDSVVRVNFGRNYETILRNVINPVNVRLVSNGFNASKLLDDKEIFEKELEAFRNDYIDYKNSIEHLLKQDCTENTDRFYSDLIVIRQKKRVIREHMTTLEQYINQYQIDLGELQNGKK